MGDIQDGVILAEGVLWQVNIRTKCYRYANPEINYFGGLNGIFNGGIHNHSFFVLLTFSISHCF